MDAKLTVDSDIQVWAKVTPQPITQHGQAPDRTGIAFSRAWAEASAAVAPRSAAEVVVGKGDTLSAIVREAIQRRDGAIRDSAQVMAWVRRVAEVNGISDPDRIYPGQRIVIPDALPEPIAIAASQTAGPASRSGVRQAAPVPSPASAATNVGAAQDLRRREAVQGHPVLERTLQRAVEKRFISAAERPAVERRILELSRQFGFSPDDFARVALMESDGFNPRASNGRCHGVIQFCEGTQRGAGSVGLAGRAQSILSMSVLRQLDLVEQYFRDTGLDRMGGKVNLDDLYLTVLTPAARATRDPQETLSIQGRQAAMLYTDGNRNASITRASLLEGLRRNADHRLGSMSPQPLIRQGGRRQDLAAAVGQISPLSAEAPGNPRPAVARLAPKEPPA